MEEQKFSISDTFNKSKEYLDTQFELLKLKAISRSARIFGSLVIDATMVLLTLLVVFFLSLALGFYLGEVLGSYSLGFLATGGIFLIFIVLIKVFAKTLELKFTNLSIKRILAKWDDDDDEESEAEANKEAFTNQPESAAEEDLVEKVKEEVNKENQGI